MRALKKVRPSDSTESLTGTLELLEPIKKFCTKPDFNLPLNFDELVKFMEATIGESEVLNIAFEYTRDIVRLLDELHQIFPKLTGPRIRNRCLKIQRKLKKAYTQYQNRSSLSSNDPETF